VAFTDTEKSNIISTVEQSQTSTENTSLKKKQRHVSDEVRLQVHQAKQSMEENIARAEKTEKRLQELDINPSSGIVRCRSLEDITGEKSAEGKDTFTKSENVSTMPTTFKSETKVGKYI
jgi:hypothetical protein